MLKRPRKLGGKLRLAFVAIAAFSILAMALSALPILQGAFRDDRIKLFVEKSTRDLADTVSSHLDQYQQRVDDLAQALARTPDTQTDTVRLLNERARQPVDGLLPWGIFDVLAVVHADGTVGWTNSAGPNGDSLDFSRVRGHKIGEFPEEEEVVNAAPGGLGKRDWYRSSMAEATRRAPLTGDISRQYNIAFAREIPGTSRILLAVVNWESIQKILDDIERPMANVGFPSTYAFMFARDSDLVIAHHYRDPADRNNYGTRLLETHNLPDVAAAAREGRPSLRYEYPPGIKKVSGFGRVADPFFAWTVGVGINDSDVVAPLRALGSRLTIIGVVIVLLSLIVAYYLSHRITLDLRELTVSALRIAEGRFGDKVVVRSRDEVGQLAGAFNAMSLALEERDSMILRQQSELLQRARLEQELSIAGEVQKRLLPQFSPQLKTLDCAGVCKPAYGVSGDYYDFLPLGPERVGLLVADVSGKGISAALLAASLQACIRTHAPVLRERCGEVMANVNTLIYEATDRDRFATVFYAVYDDSSRMLHYVNAGHTPPLLLRPSPAARAVGGTSEPAPREHHWVYLYSGSPPLGVFEALPAAEQHLQLLPGDWLVIYSDGLSEAMNDREEEFGTERLVRTVEEYLAAPDAEGMCQHILRAVHEYSLGHAQSDDITLTVAHVR
jgi:serine phosphatase RsbU (regulator of sigma subunit)